MIVLVGFVATSVLCLQSACAQAPPEITAKIDRLTATVGDPLTLTLSVRYDSTCRLVPPPTVRTLGKFDVLADSVLTNSLVRRGAKLYERSWRLAAFRTGAFWIPGLTGELIDPAGQARRWQSDSMSITIATVLAGGDTVDIRGLKGPYVAREPVWYWWPAAAIALIALLALWRLRRRRAAVSAGPPFIPPWENALAALDSLRAEVDPDLDNGRVWYFRLSEILRRYWDGRYGWQSIDETTSEIVPHLSAAPFDGAHRQRAHEFLVLADQVRYARLPARPGRPLVDWEWVRVFVSDTIPRLGTTIAADGVQTVDADPTPGSSAGTGALNSSPPGGR